MSDATETSSESSSSDRSAPATNPATKPATKTDRRVPRPVLADAKELGGQLVNAARSGANSLYEDQRNRAADEIAALGGSLQRSVKTLDGTIGEAIAPYAETAAHQVEDFAHALRERSLSQVGSDIEGVARQWPMAFLAAAVGAGFIAGRFLLSSGSPIDAAASNAGSDGTAPGSAPPRPAPSAFGNAPDAHGAKAGTGDD